MRALFFLSSFAIAATGTAGILAGGYWVFAPFALVFAFHPGADLLLGRDREDNAHAGLPAGLCDVLLWLGPLFLTVLLFLVTSRAAGLSMGSWQFWAAAHATGLLTAGIGINIGHELVHRRRSWERALGVWLFALVNYTHFRIEHVHGHHSKVATLDDPATARRGETLYAFWVRSVPGQIRSAIALENRRLGGRSLLQHRMIHYTLIALTIWGATFAAFGAAGLVFFIAQGVVAALFLETINYVEHYGLVRNPKEAVTERHSWDTDYRVTNWTLFNLGKHAKHHAAPTVPFHKLRNSPGAPRLPFGYSTMAMFAFVPPLYTRLMERELARGL